MKAYITADRHASLKPIMQYDKRRTGSHGLALTQDFPACNLLAGDRLEPSDALQDIGDFFNLAEFPVLLTFWRPSAE
eukprot:747903-Lingulodinium_polyedra.AAC.1